MSCTTSLFPRLRAARRATRGVLVALLSLAAVASGALLEPAGARVAATAATPTVDSLRSNAVRTDVVVRGLHSRAQAAWIDRVVDDRLVAVDGCSADPGSRTLRRGVYRNHVTLFCPVGTGPAVTAAARLRAAKPWYAVTTRAVPVVAFTFLADLETGNGDAVPAALAVLPRSGVLIVDGDDVSLTYVGQGVTQATLDAARAAFASALAVPVEKVAVTPIG